MAARDTMSTQEYIEALQAALQDTTETLLSVIKGHPVANIPHRMGAAETLLAGTDYPFVARY
jgi:hypothetical protein